jgi:serine/threonine-protein kinase
MNSSAQPSWKRRRLGERLGRYVLGPSIGAGGAASVYLARLDGPHGFERLLAIKIVHEHLLEDKDFIAMFLDEANLAVRLSHPNIVHTYELGHQGETLFLAMEYLRGKPLSLVYERAFAQGAPLEYELVAWLGARCADALDYAHGLTDEQGQPLSVVHRDISPDNLFVTYDGEIKVIDFGIARAEGRIARTDVGSVKGKFRYMSPEYALGRSFDHTLDLFALGASLYEAALGRAAFEGADPVRTVERLVLGDVIEPAQLRADFPEELRRILARAMNSARSVRYESGREMATDLDRQAGLTATQARARLSARMRALFEEEVQSEAALFAEVRALRPTAVREGDTPMQHELPLRPPDSAPKSRWLVAAGLLAASAAVALPLWFSRASETAQGSATAVSHAPSSALEAPPPAPTPVAASTPAPLEAQPQSATSAPSSERPGGAPSALAVPSPRPPNAKASAKAAKSPAPASASPPRAPTSVRETAREPSGVIRANPFSNDP